MAGTTQAVLGPQLSRLREVRVGHVVYRATECWVGKLNQESCPPCWVNSWGSIQASDSQGNLAIQALEPWAIELSPAPGLTLLPRHLLPVRMVSDLGSAESALCEHEHSLFGQQGAKTG